MAGAGTIALALGLVGGALWYRSRREAAAAAEADARTRDKVETAAIGGLCGVVSAMGGSGEGCRSIFGSIVDRAGVNDARRIEQNNWNIGLNGPCEVEAPISSGDLLTRVREVFTGGATMCARHRNGCKPACGGLPGCKPGTKDNRGEISPVSSFGLSPRALVDRRICG